MEDTSSSRSPARANAYIQELLASKSLKELMRIANEVEADIESVNDEMRKIIYENRSDFISATEIGKALDFDVLTLNQGQVPSQTCEGEPSLKTNIDTLLDKISRSFLSQSEVAVSIQVPHGTALQFFNNNGVLIGLAQELIECKKLIIEFKEIAKLPFSVRSLFEAQNFAQILRRCNLYCPFLKKFSSSVPFFGIVNERCQKDFTEAYNIVKCQLQTACLNEREAQENMKLLVEARTETPEQLQTLWLEKCSAVLKKLLQEIFHSKSWELPNSNTLAEEVAKETSRVFMPKLGELFTSGLSLSDLFSSEDVALNEDQRISHFVLEAIEDVFQCLLSASSREVQQTSSLARAVVTVRNFLEPFTQINQIPSMFSNFVQSLLIETLNGRFIHFFEGFLTDSLVSTFKNLKEVKLNVPIPSLIVQSLRELRETAHSLAEHFARRLKETLMECKNLVELLGDKTEECNVRVAFEARITLLTETVIETLENVGQNLQQKVVRAESAKDHRLQGALNKMIQEEIAPYTTP